LVGYLPALSLEEQQREADREAAAADAAAAAANIDSPADHASAAAHRHDTPIGGTPGSAAAAGGANDASSSAAAGGTMPAASGAPALPRVSKLRGAALQRARGLVERMDPSAVYADLKLAIKLLRAKARACAQHAQHMPSTQAEAHARSHHAGPRARDLSVCS
jgi:hypothetical protein